MSLSFVYFIILSYFLSFSNGIFPKAYKRFDKRPIYEALEDISSEPLILTPLIEVGRFEEAQAQSKVNLSGLDNLVSYSGYFTVDKNYNSNTFFWFFPAEEDYANAPVVLWLQGGPGSSSIGGLFGENGPLEFKDANTEPSLREYSWSKQHSVIYIDNPVGTGFSFTDAGYCKNETIVGEHLYAALVQFFKMFPKLQKNEFYITGESYAGKYVPAISYTILKENPGAALKINLKGLCIGNGLSDPEHQMVYSPYLYQLGLIDSNTKTVMAGYEAKGLKFIQHQKWREAFEIFDELINGDLIKFPTLFKNATGLDDYFNYLETPHLTSKKQILEFSYADYITRKDVREALHVGDTPFGDDRVETNLREDVMQSVAPWVSELLANYRVLIYSGQLDIIVAYPTTLNFLQNLKFSGADEYKVAPRHTWYVDDELAGYFKKAGNLTEVLVRDAGHMVPSDQPKWALDLIAKFIRNALE